MYGRGHDALAEKIPQPDLIIYLRADIEVLKQRIALRDRPYERNMEWQYIDQLNHAYEEFFSDSGYGRHNTTAQILIIDTNRLDYVRHSEALKQVENRIRQALKLPPFQSELPLDEVYAYNPGNST